MVYRGAIFGHFDQQPRDDFAHKGHSDQEGQHFKCRGSLSETKKAYGKDNR
jgi:hypothetical protein